MARYRVVIRSFVRYLAKVSSIACMLAKLMNSHATTARVVRRWYKNFERPSRERVSGKRGHRGGSHVSVHITGIPQGRDLGAQSSVSVRVIAKCVVRA